MYPRIRNPLVVWLLTTLTSGLYLLYWGWRVAAELNSAEEKRVFNIAAWRNAFLVLFLLSMAGPMLLVGLDVTYFLLLIMSGFLSIFVYVQITIGDYIKQKYEELNIDKSYSNVLSFILLWFVLNLGIVYMQSSINRIIKHERAKS
ncbi:MAG: hypothetical protein RQ824_11875 [bacterium]|nr:hypothetical protein [bacterium]